MTEFRTGVFAAGLKRVIAAVVPVSPAGPKHLIAISELGSVFDKNTCAEIAEPPPHAVERAIALGGGCEMLWIKMPGAPKLCMASGPGAVYAVPMVNYGGLDHETKVLEVEALAPYPTSEVDGLEFKQIGMAIYTRASFPAAPVGSCHVPVHSGAPGVTTIKRYTQKSNVMTKTNIAHRAQRNGFPIGGGVVLLRAWKMDANDDS